MNSNERPHADNSWFPGGGSRPPRLPSLKGKKWLIPLALIALAVVTFPSFVRFYTDLIWYEANDAAQAFWVRIWPQWLLFGIATLLAFPLAYLNWRGARKQVMREPVYEGEGESPIRQPLWGLGILGLAVLFALSQGVGARAEWGMVLRFLHASPFGTQDPLFGQDIGFYIFKLPFYAFVRQWLLAVLVPVFLGTVAIYALGIVGRITRFPFPLPGGARKHLALLGSIIALLWALGFWLERFNLLYSGRGVAFGASYTDVHAELLALNVLSILTVALAALILTGLRRGTWKFTAVVLGLWAIANVVLRGVYPGLVQQYLVEPNEFQREKPYIEYNIASTLKAFDLDKIRVSELNPSSRATWKDIEDNQDTIRNIRLWDYSPLLRSYKQLQEIRSYYDFQGVDIDRYDFDGDYRQVMLAARELDLGQLQNPTWVNTHLEFTHGYGIVMNPVNEVTPTGQPVLVIKDLPPKISVPLDIDRPQIYYGEKTSSYVLVKTDFQEFDYPMGQANARSTYEGTGGISIGSVFRRLLFTLRFGDSKILFTNALTDESRIIFHRNVREKVQLIAPFLIYDNDPYLTVADGKLVWILDAYTTSDRYPYSEPISVQRGRNVRPLQINYIRNSVKVTVDAYDGTVRFYVSDPEDPLIRTWSGIFPTLFRPEEEMPETLRAHRRYPQDLFRIQTEVFRTYHMQDPNTFYNKEDVWATPPGVAPYYAMMRLEKDRPAEFTLLSQFLPVGRDNMISWMAGRSDGENYGDLLLYRFPKQTLIYGPKQVEALIDQKPEISAQLSLWSQRGSDVIRGTMLVLPLGETLLYVQPLYLRAENSDLPELKRVIVSTGGKIAWAETLEEALSGLLDERPPTGIAEPSTRESYTPSAGPAPEGNPSELAHQAQEHWDAAQEALREGDWGTYGDRMRQVEEVIRELIRITDGIE